MTRTEDDNVEDEAADPVPYRPVKMSLFEVPNPFAGLEPEEVRRRLVEVGREHREQFAEEYGRLAEWFEEFDAPYLLSFAAVYFLSSPEGVDPEVIDGKLDFYHHHLELLQAFALTRPRGGGVSHPLLERAQELQETMLAISESLALGELAFPGTDIPTDEEVAKQRFLADMRGQTAAIRNWAYPDQSGRLLKGLLARISETFQEAYGLDPVRLVDAVVAMAETANDRLNAHIGKLRPVLKADSIDEALDRYHNAFPDVAKGDDERIVEMVDHKLPDLKGLLLCHADLRLQDIFTFSAEDIAAAYGDDSAVDTIHEALEMWTLDFEYLAEEDPWLFLFDNPIWSQPFIRLEEGRACFPTIGAIHHFLPSMFEHLIKKAGEGAQQDYEKARAEHLEDAVDALFREYFPSADVHRGSKWTGEDDETVFENDLLVVVGSFALIVECKSGGVTPPAKRGLEKRMRRTLKELIVAPGDQANRFARHLAERPEIHRLQHDGSDANRVDARNLRHFVPIGVTLENLGFLTGKLDRAVEAGLVDTLPDPRVPSICFTDLEVAFELLETEIERIHYLARRSEFEIHTSYFGDEADLLAFYLETGFSLGKTEEERIHISLVGKSKELDPYFVARQDGVEVEKPRRELTQWWRDMISGLQARKPEGWLEIGFVLLNVMKDDQKRLEDEFRGLMNRVRRGDVEQRHNWVVLETAPRHRAFGLALFPYKELSRQDRDEMLGRIIGEIQEGGDFLGIACIGVDADEPSNPYDVLAYLPGRLRNLQSQAHPRETCP